VKGLCDTLIAEHEVIEQVLDLMAAEVDRLNAGGEVRPDFVTKAVAFVREFADGTHHHKEEVVLFPRLVEAGMPSQGGPVGVMLHEHEVGRACIRTIADSVESAAAGDPDARKAMIGAMTGYVDLLRAHIQKENMILFPMAERLLGPESQDQIENAFKESEVADERGRLWRDWVALQTAKTK